MRKVRTEYGSCSRKNGCDDCQNRIRLRQVANPEEPPTCSDASPDGRVNPRTDEYLGYHTHQIRSVDWLHAMLLVKLRELWGEFRGAVFVTRLDCINAALDALQNLLLRLRMPCHS